LKNEYQAYTAQIATLLVSVNCKLGLIISFLIEEKTKGEGGE